MKVQPKDGRCRTCNGPLVIVAADDATMSVECEDPSCADAYDVEPDAFGDGAVVYYPAVIAAQLEGRDE
jgi:hypothetical protein